MNHFGSRRGALSIHPLIIVLALALAGLATWKAVVRIDVIDKHKALGAERLKSREIGYAVATPLVFLAVGGGVGAACYFAFGRSQRAANAGVITPLALGVALLSIQAVRTYTTDPSAARTAQASASGSGLAALAGAADPPASSPAPSIAHSASGPALPHHTARDATPQISRPSGTSGSAPQSSPTPRAPVVAQPAIDANAVLAPVRVAYQTRCEALAVKAEKAYAAADKPRKVNKFLDESLALFAEVKAEADALAEELGKMGTDVRTALEAAGMDHGESMRAGMEFEREFGEFKRKVACGEVSRFAGHAEELFRCIRGNMAKVQIDATGKATSKDQGVESELFHARNFVEFGLRDRVKTVEAIRSGK